MATIPTTYIKNEENKTIGQTQSICKGCYACFDKGYKLSLHLKQNKDCKTLHEIDKITLRKCNKCETWWKNDEELRKHKEYHCHLNEEEKATSQ